MYKIIKIISGGQTGADRAGLDAAKACGIPTGGYAPKGWRVCLENGKDGSDPSLAEFGLIELATRDYPPRTKKNVAESDGTIWFGYAHSLGGKLTIGECKRLVKPCILNPSSGLSLRNWCEQNNIKTLNVAGSRASDFNPNIYETTYNTICEAFLPTHISA